MTATTNLRASALDAAVPAVSRGLLLLDVDGPLNPYRARPRPDGYASFRHTATGEWYSGRDVRRYKGDVVWLHPGHGALLLDLAADTGLELVWATTFLHRANDVIGPAVGLPALPVIEFSAADLPRDGAGRAGKWHLDGSWKWPTVADYAVGRPLAWFDDDHDDPVYEKARSRFDRDRAGAATLLCDVDPTYGLLPAHLDRVRAWAATLPGTVASAEVPGGWVRDRHHSTVPAWPGTPTLGDMR